MHMLKRGREAAEPSGNAPRPSAASSSNGLLGEAMQLSSRAPTRRAAAQTAAAPAAAAPVVERLPTDLGLKRECVVTSSAPFAWCAALPDPTTQAEAIVAPAAAGAAGPAARLRRAVAHWRYPAQRLPSTLVKQLSMPALSAERAVDESYVKGLQSDWGAALHSLYYALREGRCPYFYCRCDAYTVVWRNVDASLDPPAAERAGAAEAPPPRASSSSACYAVLAPSNRGLRSELRKEGVPFEMPRAGQAQAAEPELNAAELAAVESDLAHVNSLHDTEEMAAARERRLAAAVDNRQTSALLFPGSVAVHALYDFLLNAKSHPHLTVQLLAPAPFLHGAARAASLVCRAAPAAAADDGDDEEEEAPANGGAPAHGGAPAAHILRIDASEACGGPLLPDALPRLCEVLRAEQSGEFELRCTGLETKHAEWLNVPPPARPSVASPPGERRVQPMARLVVQEQLQQEQGGAPAADEASREWLRERQPRTLSHIRCTAGELRVLNE